MSKEIYSTPNYLEEIKYRDWYQRWSRIFIKIRDTKVNSFKKSNLLQKVKMHMWKLEYRYLCYKWYGATAKQSPMYPQSLK